MRGVYIMWINCYATIYPKKAVALYMHENQLDGRLSHRRSGVVRFFCFIFDRFFLMMVELNLENLSI